MKASAIVALLVVGLFLNLTVSGDSNSAKKCGCGMQAAGCACNQVCNEPKYACKMPCRETLDFCACLEGYSLPTGDAEYCIPADKCPSPDEP